MKITVIKKGNATAKPASFCDWLVDDPPVAPKK